MVYRKQKVRNVDWSDPKARSTYNKLYRAENIETRRAYDLKRSRDLRLKALQAYGGTPPKCACCGEKEIKFLSIDHINGGGNYERKKLSRWVNQWLKTNNYPKGYQVLCFNCNLAKGFYKKCPHKCK